MMSVNVMMLKTTTTTTGENLITKEAVDIDCRGDRSCWRLHIKTIYTRAHWTVCLTVRRSFFTLMQLLHCDGTPGASLTTLDPHTKQWPAKIDIPKNLKQSKTIDLSKKKLHKHTHPPPRSSSNWAALWLPSELGTQIPAFCRARWWYWPAYTHERGRNWLKLH